MSDQKVAELVRALHQNEIKSFRLFLQSPFYNTSPEVLTLFELLLKNNEVSKKQIHKELFGEAAFNDKKIRYLFSDLTGLLQKFFTLVFFEKDNEENNIYLQQSMSERNIRKAYSFATKKIETKKQDQRAASFLNKYRTLETSHSFDSKQQGRLSKLNYTDLLNSLDRFYFARKIQLQCELINMRNILNKEHTVSFIDPICEYVSANSFLYSPLLEVYYSILQTLRGNDTEAEAAFEKILEVVKTHQDVFSIEDLNNIYQYAKNFCIRRINRGDDKYRKTLFELYKSILSYKRLMSHDYLSPWEFKNIVTLGLRLKEGDWIKKFISKYINHLPPHERKNALTYNTAMLYYFFKNYKFVLKYLQEVEFTDLYYQLDSKSILLKVYFETDEQEALLHHIAAFKIYLIRNKNLSSYQLTIYKNFIKYSLKIFRAGTNSKKLDALKTEITSSSNISDRNWLLERITELS